MNIKITFFLALSITALSGCMNNPTPAPIEYGSSSPKPSGESDSGEIIEKPIVHETVKWGENPPQSVQPSEIQTQEEPIKEVCANIPADHEVIEGETIETIAQKYCVDKTEIISANKLKPPFVLEELQILQIPEKKTLKPVENTVMPLTPETNLDQSENVETPHLPTQGTIISKFGDMNDGISNTGINIAATLGDSIHSLSSGNVVFSGNDPKFGNLIIIKSTDNEIFMAYAHMSDLLLKKGDLVSKNQIIGHVGQTGNASSPQLHFAVRQGSTPVDPLKYLGI
jgi:LysM repeat protein